MKDFGISRVSTEEQKDSGLSAEIQRIELQQPNNKYPDKNINPLDIIRAEGVSAGFKDTQITRKFEGTKFIVTFECKERPDIIRILEHIRKHPTEETRIFFTKWDRISRDFSFLQQFIGWCKDNNTQLCPLSDSNEEIVRQLLSIFSQFERSKVVTRVNDVAKGQYHKGIWGYKIPYGYTQEESGILSIDQIKANIIIECFKSSIEAKRTNNKTLYKEICSKYKIEPSKYYNIIKNKVYMGMTHYKDSWKKTPYVPQIISDIDFYKINKK